MQILLSTLEHPLGLLQQWLTDRVSGYFEAAVDSLTLTTDGFSSLGGVFH